MTPAEKAQADDDAIQGLVARWCRAELAGVLGLPKAATWESIINEVRRLAGKEK